MANPDEHPAIPSLRRQASRHNGRSAAARRDLALTYHGHAQHAAALEDALDEISPAYQRYRISRRSEMISLAVLASAEVVVAETVVQALGLTAAATDLVAVGVGGAATGLAWLVGHEWAVSRDPQAAVTGHRGWLGVAAATAGAFLAANLGVRIYYGILADQASRLGGGLAVPVLAGVLLTTVTAALMVVAAFISAHAETSREARLRVELRRVRAALRSLENRVGALRSVPARSESGSAGDDRQSAA